MQRKKRSQTGWIGSQNVNLFLGGSKGKQLPKRYRKKVVELLPVGKLVVDEDDVYAELTDYIPSK